MAIVGFAGALALSATMFAQSANFESDRQGVDYDSELLIGAKVQGPGTNAFGYVTDFVRDTRTGEVAMYVVETYGWFNGEGVIPVANVVDIRSRQGKKEREYRIEVSVNQATFRNLAKWDGEGRISSYLDDYHGILSTVYRLDPATLGAETDFYETDARASSAARGNRSSVTMAK